VTARIAVIDDEAPNRTSTGCARPGF